jgi:hypothetical protein
LAEELEAMSAQEVGSYLLHDSNAWESPPTA